LGNNWYRKLSKRGKDRRISKEATVNLKKDKWKKRYHLSSVRRRKEGSKQKKKNIKRLFFREKNKPRPPPISGWHLRATAPERTSPQLVL